MEQILPPLMFVCLLVFLATGFQVAFALAGTGLLFMCIGLATDHFTGTHLFPVQHLGLPTKRLFSVVQNTNLMSVPLFILMGLVLERSQLAQDLLSTAERCMSRLRGGLAVAVILVGALIAAATGIVGATVVTLGVLALPTMLRGGYDPKLASGTIAASGTLGQIIPPSVVLVLLGDLLGVDVGSLFTGALIPGLLLVVAYIVYVLIRAYMNPALAPLPPRDAHPAGWGSLLKAMATGLLPTGGLILLVLGTIMAGVATPTEAAACGAVGAIIIALIRRRLNWKVLRGAGTQSASMTAMVFTILAGAQFFTVVFRDVGGEHWLTGLVKAADPGPHSAVAMVMLLMFVLGFFLDFLEICFIVVPMVLPVLAHVGWSSNEQLVLLGVLMGVNLQTSFLTPPFGFSLFYLKGAAPPELRTTDIYRGALPFVAIQIGMIVAIVLCPDLVLWLPRTLAQ